MYVQKGSFYPAAHQPSAERSLRLGRGSHHSQHQHHLSPGGAGQRGHGLCEGHEDRLEPGQHLRRHQRLQPWRRPEDRKLLGGREDHRGDDRGGASGGLQHPAPAGELAQPCGRELHHQHPLAGPCAAGGGLGGGAGHVCDPEHPPRCVSPVLLSRREELRDRREVYHHHLGAAGRALPGL